MGSSDEQVDYAMELCNAYGSDECLRDWFADEQPQLHIYLDNYWIMKTEVTNAQYRKFMEAGGYSTEEYWHPDAWIWREGWIEPGCWKDSKFKGDQHPVVCISWYKADAYTKWLSAQTGLDFGLPTEAEWEKAARGIEGFHFPWGNHWDESRLNHCKRCINQWDDKNVDSNYKPTDPVDSYQIGDSPYGMLNMAGNVWEWTTSWYDSKYHSNMSNQNPKNLENGNERVLRGGGWLSELYKMRTTYRVKLHPSGRFNDVGFRVRLSGNVHGQVRDLAHKDQVSINQFITVAVAEKVATLMTLDYIEQRALQGSREKFDRVLDKVAQANLEPLPEDRLPSMDI